MAERGKAEESQRTEAGGWQRVEKTEGWQHVETPASSTRSETPRSPTRAELQDVVSHIRAVFGPTTLRFRYQQGHAPDVDVILEGDPAQAGAAAAEASLARTHEALVYAVSSTCPLRGMTLTMTKCARL
jgi:hypothetical protein